MRAPVLLLLVAMLTPVRKASDLPHWFADAPEWVWSAWTTDNR